MNVVLVTMTLQLSNRFSFFFLEHCDHSPTTVESPVRGHHQCKDFCRIMGDVRWLEIDVKGSRWFRAEIFVHYSNQNIGG